MAEILKPTDLNKIWASSGAVVAPDDSKIALGWVVEAPPHQTENYINKKHDTAFAYLNQHGVMQWDANTEYFANRSWVQGSNGSIYKAKANNIGQNPATDFPESYWVLVLKGTAVLHLDSTTSYSRTLIAASTSPSTALTILGVSSVGQSLITQPTQTAMRNALGVGGVGDSIFTSGTQSAARTALGISSATDTSEGLVERATDAESIAGVDDVRFLTPKKLKLGFSQVLNNNGYVTYPSYMGGLILQWGRVNVPDNSNTTNVFFPRTFPNACFNVQLTGQFSGTADYEERVAIGYYNLSTSGFRVTNPRDGGGTLTTDWFAIGY